MRTVKYCLLLGVAGVLSSCSQFSFRSRESIDAEEKKPWNRDEGTVEGAFNKSNQRLTPHIGFKVPVDNGPDSLKVPESKKPEEIRTSIDKKRQTITILKKDDAEKDERMISPKCSPSN